MNELWESLKEMATTPSGAIILALAGVAVLAAAVFLLWRGIKHMMKAVVWLVWTLLALAAIAVALWFWLERQSPDPDRLERVRAEAIGRLREGADKLRQDGRDAVAEPLEKVADKLADEAHADE